jgi:F-type H+-transporting ATPase subunit delta
MPTDRILTRKESAVYAQALLEATQKSDTVFLVTGQIEQVKSLVRSNMELRTTLYDSAVPVETRIAIVNEVFAGFDASLLAVLGVMIKRDDLRLLAKVAEAFIYAVEEALGVVIIDTTTVVALDDALRDSIKAKYSAQFGRDVLLREHVDPSIMGGIVLSTHGVTIDASVVSQLENVRAVLSDS